MPVWEESSEGAQDRTIAVGLAKSRAADLAAGLRPAVGRN